MKKSLLTIVLSGIVIIALAVVTMMYFSSLKKNPPIIPHQEPIRYVKAQAVNYDDDITSVVATGRVYSQSEVALSSEVSGKILTGDIQFKKGQNFKKGDILLKIYSAEFLLGLKSKKSLYLNKLASLLPDMRIDFPDDYSKWYSFFEAIDIEKPLQELPEINTTKEKVFLASRNILSDYYTIQSQEIKFNKHFIIAPFSGTITEAAMEVGAIASPNGRLGRIINTGRLEIEVPVEVENAKWIKKGDVAKIHLGNKNHIKGKVVRKSGAIDPNTQSISIFVSVRNSTKNPIYKGEYKSVEFHGIKLFNVMELPRNAVFNHDGVYTILDSVLTKSKINLIKVNQTTLFFNGLDEGVMIVTEPLINANENTKVRIIENTKSEESNSMRASK